MKLLHYIVSGLSLTIVLLSLNRLSSFTLSYLQPYEFLRWLDFNAMIPIPLLTIVLYYLLKRNIQQNTTAEKSKYHLWINLAFIAGVYFFAAGSGDHEVTNYLNTRFCDAGELKNELCNIISYNDDEFSHIIYYIGFILLNISLMATEFTLPRKVTISSRDLKFLWTNGLFIALGIFANLAFEEIGLDLLFFGSMAILSTYLLFFAGKSYKNLPVISYLVISYGVGVASTLLYKLLFS